MTMATETKTHAVSPLLISNCITLEIYMNMKLNQYTVLLFPELFLGIIGSGLAE
jgi:hypothetical protein